MRIAKLDLLAYGPFRGLTLDLSSPGVHVVFGRNEAGKSTTLRAITGLLYGIDARTRDAHVHKPTDLRIGGTIIGDDGDVVRLVRRKGNTNTLLDERGQPIDDAVLVRHLRGVSRETFEHAFGIDDVTLREGAKALLDGKGDLGESLFDASVGGGGEVQRLVAELDAEADALFTPRGKTLPLNEALKTFSDAQKAIREKEMLPAAYLTQQSQLEETKTVRTEKVQEKAEHARRRATIDAARKRAPLERRRAALGSERDALALGDEEAMAIDALVRRIPDHERAVEERKRIAAERIRAEARVEDAGRRAGVDARAVKDGMRLDAPKQARVFKLVIDRDGTVQRLADARVEIERQERALAKLVAGPDGAPEAATADVAALARALERARSLGDLEARVSSDRAKAERKRRELESKATALGGHAHALDALVALELPTHADVDAFAKRADAAERTLARAEAELEKTTRDLDQVDGEIAESEGGFAPPDASELRQARSLRDERWAAIRTAKTPIERIAAEGAFESTLRDVDGIVDRMLAEADRVTNLARLKARRAHLAALRTKHEAEVESARGARTAVDAELRARFATAAVKATTAAAMRTWLTNRAALAESRAELVEHEREAATNAHRVEEATAAVAKALGRDGGGRDGSGRLADLVAEAAARVSASEDARRAALEAGKHRAKIEEDLDARRANVTRDEASLSEARAKLAELVSAVGVEPDASAEEIRSAVDSMRELFEASDERGRVLAAAAAVEKDLAAFAGDVAHVRGVSGEVAGESAVDALDAANALSRRRERFAQLERDLAEVDARLAELGNAPIPDDVAALAADPEAAARAIDDLDANVDVLERELKSLDERIGGIKHGLDLMRGDSHAADAAARAQEALARVRTNAEKWVRAKLASVILKREIERYREENQGPLLSRASSLFARLTLGAFTGLRAGFDEKDRASLRIVRAGGTELDVDALSVGTRDQLYLSLRLASLLRYAEISAPMPLVLDDVLIHFDDERSSAALSVLAEISKTVQVLFFTHHARLVDLARAAIPTSELTIHELAIPRPALVESPAP